MSSRRPAVSFLSSIPSEDLHLDVGGFPEVRPCRNQEVNACLRVGAGVCGVDAAGGRDDELRKLSFSLSDELGECFHGELFTLDDIGAGCGKGKALTNIGGFDGDFALGIRFLGFGKPLFKVRNEDAVLIKHENGFG